MKKILLYISVVLISFITIQCSTLKIAAPTQSDVEKAKSKYPDASLENLNAGHIIYTTKCSKCHGVKNPVKYSEVEWEKIIEKMAPKAKLTAEEKNNLSQYIFAARESASPLKK